MLENLKAEIEALKMLINQRSEHANKAARSVQIMGSANNIVDFLLGADSIDEVFNRIDVVSTLVRSNQDVITQQQEDIYCNFADFFTFLQKFHRKKLWL